VPKRPLELEALRSPGLRNGGWRRRRPRRGCCGQYSDENGAADFSDFERDHEDEAKQCQRGGGIAQVAHSDEGFRVADDQARVAKTDEGDEESDAAGNRCVKFVGMERRIICWMPPAVIARNMTPERKTAPRAVCQGMCILRQTV